MVSEHLGVLLRREITSLHEFVCFVRTEGGETTGETGGQGTVTVVCRESSFFTDVSDENDSHNQTVDTQDTRHNNGNNILHDL